MRVTAEEAAEITTPIVGRVSRGRRELPRPHQGVVHSQVGPSQGAALCAHHVLPAALRGQEAVIRAFLSLKSYRRSAPFTAWLAKIALNASHDYHRSAWKRRVLLAERTPEEEDNACPSGEVERREMLRKVRDSVSRLPEKMRTPIWLHYFEDFSIAEVAELERTSESTIRARLKAGMSRLFVVLNDYVGSGTESAVRPLEARECKI